MKKGLKIGLLTILGLLLGWALLTVWVEQKGGKKQVFFGSVKDSSSKVLIVYDPDPIYNLDEQVCSSFGSGLASQGVYVSLATVEIAETIALDSFDLFVFCANTYNWSPDWAMTNFVEERKFLGKKVVAITVGSGSTEEAQKAFEAVIRTQGLNLIDSRSFWLMRPNDESRMQDSNIEVARSMAFQWAVSLGKQLR